MPASSADPAAPRRRLGSKATTHEITVIVEPFYLAEHSRPEANQFVFAYRVRVCNQSDQPVTLLERRWTIVDAEGVDRRVRGEGVIGKKPRIKPGQEFVYASYCPLHTNWGTMEGEYLLQREDGDVLTARIGRFFLVAADEHTPEAQISVGQESSGSSDAG
jgi:ApaG protein